MILYKIHKSKLLDNLINFYIGESANIKDEDVISGAKISDTNFCKQISITDCILKECDFSNIQMCESIFLQSRVAKLQTSRR